MLSVLKSVCFAMKVVTERSQAWQSIRLREASRRKGLHGQVNGKSIIKVDLEQVRSERN